MTDEFVKHLKAWLQKACANKQFIFMVILKWSFWFGQLWCHSPDPLKDHSKKTESHYIDSQETRDMAPHPCGRSSGCQHKLEKMQIRSGKI